MLIKKITWFVLFVLLLTFWTAVITKCAEAGERKLWLNVHLASWHSDDTYTQRDEIITYQEPHGVIGYEPKVIAPYREHNFGLGFGYAFNDEFEARAGFYNNSVDKTSFYIGGAATTSRKRRVSIGIFGGFVSGYEDGNKGGDIEYKKIMPFILPIAQINFRRWRIEPGYEPKITSDGDHILTLTAGINF